MAAWGPCRCKARLSSWTDYSGANRGRAATAGERLARLYAAFAHDKAGGATGATPIADAVDQHRLIDPIQQSSQGFPG